MEAPILLGFKNDIRFSENLFILLVAPGEEDKVLPCPYAKCRTQQKAGIS